MLLSLDEDFMEYTMKLVRIKTTNRPPPIVKAIFAVLGGHS
jgi:hypothetical protein